MQTIVYNILGDDEIDRKYLEYKTAYSANTKNHEFRTKKPKKDFDYIIVYVPAPIKELKYILKVKQPVVRPNNIIVDGYGNKEFNNTEKEKYAYPIESVYKIKKAIKLDILKQELNFTTPQSFAYGEKYQKLLEYIDKVGTTKLY